MTEQLTLQRADLLYRTRGRDWDYCFLLQPAPLLSEGWYTLHRRIFLNVEPEPSPVLLRGALGVGTGQPFLATTFTDRARRDSQGRTGARSPTTSPGWGETPSARLATTSGLRWWRGSRAPSTPCSTCSQRACSPETSARWTRCWPNASERSCRPPS
jgi:hypothetical protein